MREVLLSSLAILSPFALQATEELGTMPFASKMGCCKPEKVEECKPCKPVTCCVRKDEPCPECVRNAHGTLGVKTNLAYVSHNGFILTGDFLWWQAQEDGLAPVNEVTTVGTTTTSLSTKSKKKNLNFRWSPGFRVGAGARFGDDGWDLYTNWTRFYTHANKSVKVPVPLATGFFPPLSSHFLTESWLEGMLGTPFQAHAHWKLRYNIVDLEFGRHFFLSKRLAVRPHFGVRGAFINQRYRINYRDVELINTSSPLPPGTLAFVLPNTSMRAKNDFNGVGLRLGSDIQFQFARHWNLIAALSASLIEGRFDLKQTFQTALPQAGSLPPGVVITGPFTYKNNFWAMRANFEESFGLQWETFFNCDKFHVAVSLLYEFSQWLQQNELSSIRFDRNPIIDAGNFAFGAIDADTEKHGNLNLQGATVRVEFKF